MDDLPAREIQDIIDTCADKLSQGSLPPWKVEGELTADFGINPPKNFGPACICRRRFIESATGEKFNYIRIPDRPYKTRWHCPQHDLVWELDARDENLTCSLCGGPLCPLEQYAPLVSNYVGGCESYFSYAGRIQVKGAVEKVFTNLLVYGTGLGPIGVTRGCHLINRLGGAMVQVEDHARAVRCHGIIFSSDALRQEARALIEKRLSDFLPKMDQKLEEFSGRISAVDFESAESGEDYILFIDFAADFVDFRGHGDISRAVGWVKTEIESLLQGNGIAYALSVIAQGHDGDLKPSPRNKRGRRASAEVRIPYARFQRLLNVHPDKFLSFVKIDRLGAHRLGCQFYSGMGGEIIPAVYKAVQINPQSPLVSSFQNIYAKKDRDDVVYGVELPNIEAGIVSNREGLISPVGREALRIMDIRSAKEFAAALAAQVLAGEFNLALEISREKLYRA
jgi:hypothetical protein